MANIYETETSENTNVVRWFHFRRGFKEMRLLFIRSVSLIQRVLRGHWGRKIAWRRKQRYLASIVIQRICCRGHLARKFYRKNAHLQNSITVIQLGGSIYARMICPKLRQDRIDEEKRRRKLEDRAVEIKVNEHLDYLKTKKAELSSRLRKRKFARNGESGLNAVTK